MSAIRGWAAAALLGITFMGVGAVQSACAQPATKDIAAALSYFDAIDAGNWEAARKKRADSSEYTADQLKESWSKWAEARGSEKNWRGVASEEWTEGGVTEVFVPIAATDGHSGIAVQLKAGLVTGMRIQPSYAKYGPYAYLTERAVVYTGGEVQRWHLAPTGRAVISELRGADGLIRRMEIIKSSGVGSLLMLSSSECPDSVCGQVGTLQGGVAAWKVPMASGGWEGKFHNLKVWNEGNVLVMHYPDPPYNQTPQRLAVIKSPPMTQEQRAELHSKVSQLEPLVESQVAQEVSAQLGRAQRLSDRYAAEKRSSERTQRFNNAMGAMNEVLTAANEVATANEAQSRAELNATIAQMNAQAAMQRQQQTSTQANPQPTGARQQGQVGENGSASSASTSQASAIQSPATATPPAVGDLAKQNPVAAGQPLRFVLLISMRNLPGDKVNSTCYSNVITRPGPPGWGSPGFLPPGSGEQARETIESLKSQFIAQCQSSGRAISSEGNFNWLSNQTQEQAQRLGSTGAKYREDVSVQLN